MEECNVAHIRNPKRLESSFWRFRLLWWEKKKRFYPDPAP